MLWLTETGLAQQITAIWFSSFLVRYDSNYSFKIPIVFKLQSRYNQYQMHSAQPPTLIFTPWKTACPSNNLPSPFCVIVSNNMKKMLSVDHQTTIIHQEESQTTFSHENICDMEWQSLSHSHARWCSVAGVAQHISHCRYLACYIQYLPGICDTSAGHTSPLLFTRASADLLLICGFCILARSLLFKNYLWQETNNLQQWTNWNIFSKQYVSLR